MFKKIIKSVFVFGVILATGTMATKAYFTSSAASLKNNFQTGKLLVGIASTEFTDSAGEAYNLAYDQLFADGGTQNSVAEFPALENPKPGETQDVYFAVYNRGTLPFNYRMFWNGEWTSLPNYDGDVSAGNDDLIYVTSIYRYATKGWVPGEYGPYNINNWLNGYGYSWLAGQTENTWGYSGGWWDAVWNDNQELGPQEFSVYRATLKLDEDTPDNYQYGSFEYGLSVEAKQTDASW